VKNYFIADVGRISAALIDSQKAFELLSASLLDIDMRYWVTSAKTRMGMTVGWLQLDYQAENAREPVMLAPTSLDHLVPVLQTLAVKDNSRSVADILSFDFIDMSIAELDFTIEESFLFDLLDFLNAVSHRKSVQRRVRSGPGEDKISGAMYENESLMKMPLSTYEPSVLELAGIGVDEVAGKESRVYIRELFLSAVKVNLSLLKGKKSGWDDAGHFVRVDNRMVRVLKQTEGEMREQLSLGPAEKSDAFVAWSQHITFDDQNIENGGRFLSRSLAVYGRLFAHTTSLNI
jgi:hypothetical protein